MIGKILLVSLIVSMLVGGGFLILLDLGWRCTVGFLFVLCGFRISLKQVY